MTQAVLAPSPVLVAGTLDQAITLQDEIRQLKENMAIVQREVDRRQAHVNTIIDEHMHAGVWNEGPLFIKEKPGRRSLNLTAFEKEFPDEFKQVAKVKMTATIADAEKVLSGEAVDSICTRADSTFEIDVMISGGSE